MERQNRGVSREHSLRAGLIWHSMWNIFSMGSSLREKSFMVTFLKRTEACLAFGSVAAFWALRPEGWKGRRNEFKAVYEVKKEEGLSTWLCVRNKNGENRSVKARRKCDFIISHRGNPFLSALSSFFWRKQHFPSLLQGGGRGGGKEEEI